MFLCAWHNVTLVVIATKHLSYFRSKVIHSPFPVYLDYFNASDCDCDVFLQTCLFSDGKKDTNKKISKSFLKIHDTAQPEILTAIQAKYSFYYYFKIIILWYHSHKLVVKKCWRSNRKNNVNYYWRFFVFDHIYKKHANN